LKTVFSNAQIGKAFIYKTYKSAIGGVYMSKTNDVDSIVASIESDRMFIQNWTKGKIEPYEGKLITEKAQLAKLSQAELADIYYKKISELLGKLAELNITDVRKIQLSSYVTVSSFSAVIVAPLLALLSFFLVFITKDAYTALTNLVSVIPPFFVTLYKGKLENCYTGSQYLAKLDSLKFKIDLALKREELKDKVVQEVETALVEYEQAISQLGSA
jgi:hypothetical protein